MVDRPDVEAPQGVEPTGTNSRTATHTFTPSGVARTSITRTTGRHPARHMDQSFSRVHYPVPNPPRSPTGTRASTARGMYNRRFAAAMAQGRRPDPFRTRKLRPGTAMVLHPEGCGRVARRRTQTSQGGDTTACPLPFLYTRTHTRATTPGQSRRGMPDTRGQSHTHAHATRGHEANPIPGHTTPAHREAKPHI